MVGKTKMNPKPRHLEYDYSAEVFMTHQNQA